MPYFVYAPNVAPYVLDDEDAHFLQYFERWGWPYEQRPTSDPQIQHAVEREEKINRPSLYMTWENEYRRRVRTEEKRTSRISEEVRLSRREEATRRAEEGSGGQQKKGLRKKMSKWFGRKKTDEREMTRYKNGMYVNHLEDLQKTWVSGESDGGPRSGHATNP